MFNVGQLRGSYSDEVIEQGNRVPKYYSNITGYSVKSVDSIENISVGNFIDTALELPNEGTYNVGEHYYLRFSVVSIDTQQDFTVYLQTKGNKDVDNRQRLSSFTVPANTGKTYYFDLIVTPDSAGDELVFTLKRIRDDYLITGGRRLTIKVLLFQKMKEIMDIIGATQLTKFAVQSAPGLLMCINGEEIHIGRTGIYELIFEDIVISSVCFALQEGNKFVIDYQY